MTGSEARPSFWDVFFDRHLGISEPDNAFLAVSAGLDHKLLRPIGSPLGAIAGHLGFIYHPHISLTLFFEYFLDLSFPFSSACL